jgi:hypothetical protein
MMVHEYTTEDFIEAIREEALEEGIGIGSLFIEKIREYEKTGLSLDKSVEYAVRYCLEHNILLEFLKEHGSEVISMMVHEYTTEDFIEAIREEALEEGTEKGIVIGTEKGIGIAEIKWQSIVADKDAEIARLQAMIGSRK